MNLPRSILGPHPRRRGRPRQPDRHFTPPSHGRRRAESVAAIEGDAAGFLALSGRDFDLVFLDLQLPKEGRLRRPLLGPTPAAAMRVVALTANVTRREVLRRREAGFDGFIGKPIDGRRFSELLRKILEGESVSWRTRAPATATLPLRGAAWARPRHWPPAVASLADTLGVPRTPWACPRVPGPDSPSTATGSPRRCARSRPAPASSRPPSGARVRRRLPSALRASRSVEAPDSRAPSSRSFLTTSIGSSPTTPPRYSSPGRVRGTARSFLVIVQARRRRTSEPRAARERRRVGARTPPAAEAEALRGRRPEVFHVEERAWGRLHRSVCCGAPTAFSAER